MRGWEVGTGIGEQIGPQLGRVEGPGRGHRNRRDRGLKGAEGLGGTRAWREARELKCKARGGEEATGVEGAEYERGLRDKNLEGGAGVERGHGLGWS